MRTLDDKKRFSCIVKTNPVTFVNCKIYLKEMPIDFQSIEAKIPIFNCNTETRLVKQGSIIGVIIREKPSPKIINCPVKSGHSLLLFQNFLQKLNNYAIRVNIYVKL